MWAVPTPISRHNVCQHLTREYVFHKHNRTSSTPGWLLLTFGQFTFTPSPTSSILDSFTFVHYIYCSKGFSIRQVKSQIYPQLKICALFSVRKCEYHTNTRVNKSPNHNGRLLSRKQKAPGCYCNRGFIVYFSPAYFTKKNCRSFVQRRTTCTKAHEDNVERKNGDFSK